MSSLPGAVMRTRLAPAVRCLLGIFKMCEAAGRFDYVVDVVLLPGKFCRIFFGCNKNFFAVDEEVIAFGGDGMGVFAVDGVVFEKVGEIVRWDEVIDGDNIDFFGLEGNAKNHSADTPEAVDGDTFYHEMILAF